MAAMQWTTNDMPDLTGYRAVVTGANSGLGLETTKALAAKGAHVIMACRNLESAGKAQELIKASVPQASLEVRQLDLASLASVRAFAAALLAEQRKLHLLYNNAGLMAIPRRETQDGFEMQFGTNHLGHFALTGLLLPLMLATAGSRIVITTSAARQLGRIRLDDLNRTKSYGRWEAYGQSKLANLLFSFELQRRLAAAEASTISVAAHPGYSNTNLQGASVTASGSAFDRITMQLGALIAQSGYMGTLPQLYAGTSPAIRGGELVGPGDFGGLRGYPRIETSARKEDDQPLAAQLWDASVKLTGVDFAALRTFQHSTTN
ncbi:MAG: oxidoreductase [Ktedonobacteraceae bacterium]